jgi:regulatory protein
MIKQELRRKGLETDVIEEAVENIDDSENAYRAALNKARHLPAADFPAFQQKLGGFLQRRGFSYAVAKATVKRLWQEKRQEEASGESNDQ